MKTPNWTAYLIAGAMLFAGAAVAEPPPHDTLTLYHHAERSWGVGTLHLSRPLPFRDGKIMAFPSQFTDLLWAPDGTKPRNMLLVHEVWPDDKDKPFLQDKDDIFAPILHLPDHSYWKDNLPFTNRHQVAGGRRYVFRGEQIPDVRKVLDAYLKAHDTKGMQRWKDEVVAVAAGLLSAVQIVREDSVTWFQVFPTLARDYDERATPSIKAYLSGNAPAEEKAKLIDALVAAKIESLRPLLEEVGKKQDAAAAAALRGLAAFGDKPSTEALLGESRSASVDVQAYALELLGSRAATDDAAYERCKEVLGQLSAPPRLGSACLAGLAGAGGDRVGALLVSVVEQGDTGARAAAAALAGSGSSPAAEQELTRILQDKRGEPAMAAAAGLARMPGCGGCAKTLEAQHDAHPDESVRNLIGILLGVPMVHKH